MYHYIKNGETKGPISKKKVIKKIENEKFTRNSQLWKEGTPEWQFITQFPEFAPYFKKSKPPIPVKPSIDNMRKYFPYGIIALLSLFLILSKCSEIGGEGVDSETSEIQQTIDATPIIKIDTAAIIEKCLKCISNQTPTEKAQGSMTAIITNKCDNYKIKIGSVGFKTVGATIFGSNTPKIRSKKLDIILNPSSTKTLPISWNAYSSRVTAFYALKSDLLIEQIE